MQVLHVCSEMFPLLKTGGLADVLGALPAAQIAGGVDTRVLLPAFPDFPMQRLLPVARPSRDVSPCCLDITMA